MEYLKQEYWSYFKKENGCRDGLRFEALIKEILDLEHGEGKWTPTKQTHDGSKDFYWYNSGKRSWAECKNYASTIALNTLSPTMVMAQICGVDEILFFSYSPINSNTKKKLLHFAERGNKRIFFIDDDALEQLIFHYKDKLLPKYFESFLETNIELLNKRPEIHISVFSDPLLYYNPEN